MKDAVVVLITAFFICVPGIYLIPMSLDNLSLFHKYGGYDFTRTYMEACIKIFSELNFKINLDRMQKRFAMWKVRL